MRRFSQKHQLATLSDINVTPLLDLSFVLLIIFMITTPLLEQGVTLELPGGGSPDDAPIDRDRIHTVDITPGGAYLYRGQQASLEELESLLSEAIQADPDLIVYARVDTSARWGSIFPLQDMCGRIGVSTFSYRSNPDLEP